jgi:hypothetical protein
MAVPFGKARVAEGWPSVWNRFVAVDAPWRGEAPIGFADLVVEIKQTLQLHALVHREWRRLRGKLLGS